jgi:hypothetical protein
VRRCYKDGILCPAITPAGKNTTEKTERKRGATTDATDEHGSREKDKEETLQAWMDVVAWSFL